jgi:hypothetical protein
MLQMDIATPAETQGFKNTGLLAWACGELITT